MVRNCRTWMFLMINICFLIAILLLFSNIKCETDSSKDDNKEDAKEDYKRWASAAYWHNHKPYYNYVYAKNRESKSNNEPYFTEPNNNNNEGYESMPSTIQITAIPGGLGAPGLFPATIPGITGTTDPLNPFFPNTLQKFPVFVINKSKGGEHFKWLIPLLLILGAPLLCGLLLIPVALQSVFFFMTIVRNLGILLPLIPAITGGANPIIPTTG